MADLSLINLTKPGVFTFQFFPDKAAINDRVNWEPQNLAHGTQPLFYANRDPRRISFDELWLDNAETNETLRPVLEQLESLIEETEETGIPPVLLAVWGDRQERCVIEELEVEETFFNSEGIAIRARLRLSLLRFQPDRTTSTGTRILDEEGGMMGG